jgi:hypothetical protein
MSESCRSQNLPWSAAASAASESTRARGCLETTGKWRKMRLIGSAQRITFA